MSYQTSEVFIVKQLSRHSIKVCGLRLIILWLTALTLSACDKLCSNQCPDGQIHNSFCGCFVNYGQHNPPPAAAPVGDVIPSACICGEDAGGSRATAWFTAKPARYGKDYGQVIKVSAGQCADLTVCPMVGDQQYLLTGRQNIQIAQWQQVTNLIYGLTSYSVEGPTEPVEAADTRDQLPPTLSRIAYTADQISTSFASAVLDNRGVTVAASTKPIDCRAECNLQNPSPLCEVAPYPANTQQPLVQLESRLQKPRVSISSMELLKMFGQEKDDCQRGVTSIADGRLSNSGNACDVSTKLQQLNVDAIIKVPPKVTGLITESGQAIHIEFPEPSQAARLELSDTGLNSRFGGYIKSIDADSVAIRFGMPRACIAIAANQEP
jgi:hypothetical protein